MSDIHNGFDCFDENESFAELDAFLAYLSELSEHDRMMVLDPIRFNEFKFACAKIAKIARKTSPDAKIDISNNDVLLTGSGSISIETDEFTAKNIAEFTGAIKYASNFDVFPLKNGNIKIEIEFHGVWKSIKQQ